ncbi:MAG: hypothetical protein NUV74_02095 [Candidatus Brocadiaceae bacterium]|nr:hypothetical protein [Candidatus Brocadiaceae bacterium]
MQVCKIVKSFVSVILEDFEELIKVMLVIFLYGSTVRLGEACPEFIEGRSTPNKKRH